MLFHPSDLYQREEVEFQGWSFQGQESAAGAEAGWATEGLGCAASGASCLASIHQMDAAMRAHSAGRSRKESSAGRVNFLNLWASAARHPGSAARMEEAYPSVHWSSLVLEEAPLGVVPDPGRARDEDGAELPRARGGGGDSDGRGPATNLETAVSESCRQARA